MRHFRFQALICSAICTFVGVGPVGCRDAAAPATMAATVPDAAPPSPPPPSPTKGTEHPLQPPATAAKTQRTGFVGFGLKDDGGKLVVSKLTVGLPAEKAGIRLGDRLVRVGRSRESMLSVDGKTAEEAVDLIAGDSGETVWLSVVPSKGHEPVDRAVVLAPRGPDDAPVRRITWKTTGFMTFVPLTLVEQFPGSPRTYEFTDNRSQMIAFPEKFDGKRVAVLTPLLFPVVERSRAVLRLFDQMDSPVGVVNRDEAPTFFAAVVNNDPRQQICLMHVKLHLPAGGSKIQGTIEEMMFLDEKNPDVYKPLIDETIPSTDARPGHPALAVPKEKMTLLGSSGEVSALAFSPDGKVLAGVEATRTPAVRLWDVANGKNTLTLADHKMPINSVAFSPDGKYLVTCGGALDGGGEVFVWETATGKVLEKLSSYYGYEPRSTTFAGGGKHLAWIGKKSAVMKLDVATATPVVDDPKTAEATADRLHADRNGKLIAATRGPKGVRVWDAESGNDLANVAFENDSFHSYRFEFSPDGKLMTVHGGSDFDRNAIHVFSTTSGKSVATIRIDPNMQFRGTPVFSPDGKTLASATADSRIRMWNATTGQLISSTPSPTQRVRCVAFSPDGRLLASGGADKNIKLWDLQPNE